MGINLETLKQHQSEHLVLTNLFACGALSVVDGAAASVTRGIIHHTVCPTHRIVQLSVTTAVCITAHYQVIFQRGSVGTRNIMKRNDDRQMGGCEEGRGKTYERQGGKFRVIRQQECKGGNHLLHESAYLIKSIFCDYIVFHIYDGHAITL